MARSLCLLALVAALGNLPLLTEGSVVPAVAAAAAVAASLGGHEEVSSGAPQALKHSRRKHWHRAPADHVARPANTGEGGYRGDIAGASSRPLLWLVGLRRFGSRRDAAVPRGSAADRGLSAAAAAARRGCVFGLRGGSTAAVAGEEEPEAGKGVVRSMKILVSTTKISSFVDAVRAWCQSGVDVGVCCLQRGQQYSSTWITDYVLYTFSSRGATQL